MSLLVASVVYMRTTPMSKLDIRMAGLAVTSTLYVRGGTCMPSKNTPKKRQLDQLACVYPNAAGLDITTINLPAKCYVRAR